MTDDLISRSALISALQVHGNRVQGLSGKWETVYSPGVRLCLMDAQDAPAVDAEPVRNGRWVNKQVTQRTPFAENYSCSECGEDGKRYWKRCPACGAKMTARGPTP